MLYYGEFYRWHSSPKNPTNKGHPPNADLKYGEKDSIIPSSLIFAAIKG